MKKISRKELRKILEKHHKWLQGEPDGERANLSHMDLSYADLSLAILRGADLSYADLSGANLRCAFLDGADLSCADLRGADLSCAGLIDAVLCGANLCGADLRWAYLHGADLSDAKLNNCIGNGREVKSMKIDTWDVVLCANSLSIGYETHSVDEWESFDDARIARMNVVALEWWTKWRHIILEIARMSN